MDKRELEQLARDLGADFFGVADLEPFRNEKTIPQHLTEPYTRAISMGVALSRGIMEGIIDEPTPHYSHHYQTVNALLDVIALKVARALEKQGHRSIPIPASQSLDRADWLGAISHKAVARMAGLGWQGKSLLLVNPEVGPRLRLVTVLTDANLEADQPLPNRCGKCRKCAEACPAGAIKGRSFGTEGYSARSDAWDMDACFLKIRDDFPHRLDVTPNICGVCIQACPVGRKLKKKG